MLDELPEDVRRELDDENFRGRLHGKRSCYKAGCSGPLCARARRKADRALYARRRAEQGKEYTPDERVRIVDPREDLLVQILADHWRTVLEERIGVAS